LAAQDFSQQQARGASVEIRERMDEQEASFGESERFQQQHLFSSQSDIQVGEVIADEQRDLVRERWRVLADFDFGCAKSSRPIGSKVAADVAMKVEQQRFVQRARGENAVFDILQHPQ